MEQIVIRILRDEIRSRKMSVGEFFLIAWLQGVKEYKDLTDSGKDDFLGVLEDHARKGYITNKDNGFFINKTGMMLYN
jgi:hypothetical protein